MSFRDDDYLSELQELYEGEDRGGRHRATAMPVVYGGGGGFFNTIKKLLMLVIVLALLGGVGYFAYTQFLASEEGIAVPSLPSSEEQAIPTPVAVAPPSAEGPAEAPTPISEAPAAVPTEAAEGLPAAPPPGMKPAEEVKEKGSDVLALIGSAAKQVFADYLAKDEVGVQTLEAGGPIPPKAVGPIRSFRTGLLILLGAMLLVGVVAQVGIGYLRGKGFNIGLIAVLLWLATKFLGLDLAGFLKDIFKGSADPLTKATSLSEAAKVVSARSLVGQITSIVVLILVVLAIFAAISWFLREISSQTVETRGAAAAQARHLASTVRGTVTKQNMALFLVIALLGAIGWSVIVSNGGWLNPTAWISIIASAIGGWGFFLTLDIFGEAAMKSLRYSGSGNVFGALSMMLWQFSRLVLLVVIFIVDIIGGAAGTVNPSNLDFLRSISETAYETGLDIVNLASGGLSFLLMVVGAFLLLIILRRK